MVGLYETIYNNGLVPNYRYWAVRLCFNWVNGELSETISDVDIYMHNDKFVIERKYKEWRLGVMSLINSNNS